MNITDLTLEERQQLWELIKQRTGLDDQELEELLMANVREDDDLASFTNPDD